MTDKEIEYKVIGCVFDVYNELGPGLLETCYEQAMVIALREKGLHVESQVNVPIVFHGEELDNALKLDIIVE